MKEVAEWVSDWVTREKRAASRSETSVSLWAQIKWHCERRENIEEGLLEEEGKKEGSIEKELKKRKWEDEEDEWESYSQRPDLAELCICSGNDLGGWKKTK